MLLQLRHRGERCPGQGLALQDGEPNLDLVEPRCPRRREVEMDIGMALEPADRSWLVGVEVVEDDVDCLSG